MATITAALVKQLRENTGLPMMECKQALTESDGDFEQAKDWLRKKHRGKLADRAARETGEGRIGVYIDEARKVGGMIELQCETAPVAKTELFVNLANGFAQKVAEGAEQSPDPGIVRNDPQMDTRFMETYGKLRETMNLVKCQRLEGDFVVSYVHHDGKTGVMMALDAVPSSDSVAADLCMHTAFKKPLAIDADGLPAEEIDKVRTFSRDEAREQGKPEQIIDKIVEGRVKAYAAQNALMEQEHARSDVYGKKRVREVLADAGVTAVTGMVIMKIGGE